MERRQILKSGIAAASVVAAPFIVTGRASAANYKAEYRLSTVVGTAFPWGKGADIWINLVRERTDGRINIKMYPGVSLINGDQTREFSAIRQGVIDMAVGSTINWSPQVKQLNLFSLPFLAQDHAGLDAMTQGAVGKQIMQLVEKAGVVPLAWGENGFREVTNSKREIRTPADMQGLKFRVVGSPIFNDTFSALGANPTQMSWADAQPALASGAVEGQENPLHVFTAAKLHNLAQKFVTRWGYVADPLIFVVNRDIFNSWTPADRDVVRAAAIEAGKQEVALARAGLTKGDMSFVGEVEKLGVKVTELTPDEKAQFVKAVQPVVDKWTQAIGKDLVAQARSAVAARKPA